ncbi:MAG TPA: NADH-quinone oxidoreductase subunit C [Gaiellaceae bacterium]|nr:NADH-quinone oxidoreductase subunit C [Gaiellaceae bacterium]
MSADRLQGSGERSRQQLLDRFVEREDAQAPERRLVVSADELADATRVLLETGGHFVGTFVMCEPELELRVLVALRGELLVLEALLGEERTYPAISAVTPGAFLPERELHDLSGIVPLGHPELEPALRPDADRLTRRVVGDQTFVIPYGPVRSGVFEAIQFPIDTGGEDVLSLSVRPYFKRRGLEQRFAGLSVDHGAYLAERIAGISTVAHGLAYSQAVERLSGVEAPPLAQRWRVIHAELERVANHLDVGIKLAEDAALSVGVARFGSLKEQVMRLRARLCGSRFGRGVVAPGGVRSQPLVSAGEVLRFIDDFEKDLRRDRGLLLGTTSFIDRLVGSGRLDAETIVSLGGVGPIARACSLGIDARLERPYGAYPHLGFTIARATTGDAMARFDVRLQEIDQSIHLMRQALERLDRLPSDLHVPLAATADGEACGWTEAPSGELVYCLRVEGQTVREAHIATPSLRNWPLLSASYRGDVLTDVSFIEHSFGLTPAEADR